MERDNFVSLASLKENIVNRKVTIRKQKVDWLSIRWIQVTKDKPFAFKYRCSLNSLDQWKVVDVKRQRQGRPVDMGRVTFQPLSTGPCTIKEAKMDDLLALLVYVSQHTMVSIALSRVQQGVAISRVKQGPQMKILPQKMTD